MSPKDEAQHLITKYLQLSEEHSKECALLAVDYILEAIKDIPYGVKYLSSRDYWEEVQQEIKKL